MGVVISLRLPEMKFGTLKHTKSSGNSIALAYELYERGVIDKTDTGGLESLMIRLLNERLLKRKEYGKA